MATRFSLLLPCSMTHVAPALPHPSDILSWSWRSSPHKKTLMTFPDPPPTQHHPIVLPSIKHFDFQSKSPSSPHPPQYENISDPPPCSSPASPSPPSRNNLSTHWYGTRTSASTVSEKTAEMFSYLWFSSKRDPSHRSRRTKTSPTFAKIDPATAVMQFSPSPKFIQYVRKLLETTQVSQSVIVLSLHYVYRLRQQNSTTPAQAGSEFRVAVVALMLANKFLDDNTYTNKTWSDVAGINLEELNRMEREFLLGIDSRLYVDKATYESWLQLLKGLVLAKEKEYQAWKTLCRNVASAKGISRPTFSHSQVSRSSRPRSTSPRNSTLSRTGSFTFSMPCRVMPPAHPQTSPISMDAEDDPMRIGLKRSADPVFDSDTPPRPTKRVACLQTDRISSVQGPHSAGAAFSSTFTPSGAFSTLTIGTSETTLVHPRPSPHPNTLHHPSITQSLVQPYPANHLPFDTQPQNLYFYTLAGSPLDETDRAQVDRKAQLRYAPTEATSGYYAPQPLRLRPLIAHSANVSPREVAAMRIGPHPPPWNDEPEERRIAIPPPLAPKDTLPPYLSAVPAANFANAGPPGVNWSVSTPESAGWAH